MLMEEVHDHHDHDEHCGCDHDHDHHDHDHHEHDHHDHDEHCGCDHEHDHDHHDHHDHDHHDHDHDHDHHDHDYHEHDEHCGCGHDHHHHHHHADEVFTSWGKETPRKYTKEEMEHILKALSDTEDYGVVLRAKGMVPCTDGTWIHFDLVPGEYEVRTGAADYTGRLCVIGSKLQEEALAKLFSL